VPAVRPLLSDATDRLTTDGVASPDVDARLLLAAAAGVSSSRLLTLDVVDDGVAERFARTVARRTAREPLQHITGVAHFRHVELQVGPGVFVPRPETEVMTGWVIDRVVEIAAGTPEPPVVVDLCTGSGAIAKAVAHEAPAARVYAVELDSEAAGWAEKNLAGTGVELRTGDMADAFADLDGGVDVVVCNPPYIPLTAWESVQAEARDHDPEPALFSGADGLDAIRVLTRTAARLLRPGGWVACEHAEVQADAVAGLFLRSGSFASVRDHRDLSDRPRYLTARRLDHRGRIGADE
jgi:release factor glutamine methyltransferase